MASANAPAPYPAPRASGNALRDFLNRTVSYEDAGAPMPRALIAYGLGGAALTLLVGILGLELPGRDAVSRAGFFLVLGRVAGDLASFLHHLGIPLVCLGTLLFISGLLLLRARGSTGRDGMVVQLTCGGLGVVPLVPFLVVVVINVVVWILYVAFMVAVVVGIIWAAILALADS